MLPRPFRFEAQSAAPNAARPSPAVSAGRQFKVLLPSRAPAQLSLFGHSVPAERDSRGR